MKGDKQAAVQKISSFKLAFMIMQSINSSLEMKFLSESKKQELRDLRTELYKKFPELKENLCTTCVVDIDREKSKQINT